MKIIVTVDKDIKLQFLKIKVIGRSKVSSTSKITKITVIKKNCKEKGNRAEFLGSNPHSNGLIFSRSLKVFLEIKFNKVVIKIKIK